MSFEPRVYPEIARDLLTTLTRGTVRERIVVPGGEDPIVLDTLATRPIRRISHMEGVIDLGEGADPRELPYRFTPADYELVASGGGDEFDAVRFRPEGRRPAPGSELFINYYPVEIVPAPLTDLTVGSVVRTLMESVAAELAYEEQLLEQVYRSAFLETAEGSSLDKVVALVGVKRLPTGVPIARVRFARVASTTGRIVLPSGSVVSDAAGKLRYATISELTLEPGEAARETNAAALSPAMAAAEANTLTRLEVLVAGIGEVTNPTAATAAPAPETDEALRRRARGALHVAARGTVDALQFGLKAIDGVKDVSVTEFPNGVPGEVRIDIVYAREGDADLVRTVRSRVEALRPAGVRVLFGEAAKTRVQVAIELTLAGSGVASADLAGLKNGVEERLAQVLDALPPGGVARQAQLVSAVLSDARIVDAVVLMSPDGGTPLERLELAAGVALDLERPMTFRPIKAETGPTEGGPPVDIDLALPISLVAGVTAAEAENAIRLATQSHLDQLSQSGAALTFDGLAAAIRDDSRFALDRPAASATVEVSGQFTQLTDGLGAFSDTQGRTLRVRNLAVVVQEGGV